MSTNVSHLNYASNSLDAAFQITGRFQISLKIQCMWMDTW